jgi:hypothetical protein
MGPLDVKSSVGENREEDMVAVVGDKIRSQVIDFGRSRDQQSTV